MPPILPALPSITLNGPFWSADADLLRFSAPTRTWNLREMFVDLSTRNYTSSRVLLPGTMLVLCYVRTVRITPTTSTPVYTFTRATGQNPPAETIGVSEVRTLLASGQIALLLVQVDPAQWNGGGDPARLGSVTCLGGHISLDVLRGQASPRTSFFRALDVTEATPAANRPGASALPAGLSVDATGVSLFGEARLPWERNRITAPLQLTRVLPNPNPNLTGPVPTYRMTVDTDRLTPSEQTALTAAWTRFATSLDPGNPALGIESPSAPRWATLEVANPLAIPRMYWFVQPWQSTPASLPLHVEREELNLVLSDQALFDQEHRATSLARAVPHSVQITRTEPLVPTNPAIITVTIAANRGGTVPGQLNYAATIAGGVWTEQVSVSGAVTAYDPVETPRAIRAGQDRAAPSWAPGEDATPLSEPVLWGFFPLEDGWAQLPIPNLTTQMYVDARLALDPVTIPALFSGAVAYGNDKQGVAEEFVREQPWNLTILDAASFSGTWTLHQQGTGAHALVSIALALNGPELAFSGLLWAARGKPSIEDALPALDDWITGLEPIALRTVDPSTDLIAPLARITISNLVFTLRAGQTSDPSAHLGAWSFTAGADASLLEQMVDLNLLPADTFSRHRPLVWRRHRTLPMIQALPLTQSQSPPSYPSPSRQLAPFELPVTVDSQTGLSVPSGWTFGRTGANGAEAWPTVQGTIVAAREWSARADLPLAALSLPGLVLDPRLSGRTGLPDDGPTDLPQQYRHDLPYADEPHALAQLPKIPRPASEISPAPASPKPEPPKPLSRETLADHFLRLSERASLAALDAVAATSVGPGGVRVDALIEPLSWTATPAVATDTYPGSLTFLDSAGVESLSLREEGALKGFRGAFAEENGELRLRSSPNAGAYTLVAGSMQAHGANGMMRDQRGLLRGATAVNTSVLRTPVRLVGEPEPFELTSLLDAVPLRIGSTAWRLWFRDLPVAAGTFLRDRTRSSLAQDVNDPEASSRRFNHLNGWEWRLEPDTSGRYSLFGLGFSPLTFESAVFAGNTLQHVEIIGRLQLPVNGAPESDALANAARLVFDWSAAEGALVLSAVQAIAGATGEWPLGLSAGEFEAPRIAWTQLALSPARDAIHVDGAALLFQAFGASWRIPLSRLVFGAAPAPIVHRYAASASPSEPLPPRAIELTIDRATGSHAVSLLLGVRLGRGVTSMPAVARPQPLVWTYGATPEDPRLDGVRSAFTADVRFEILGANTGQVTWSAGYLFDDLTLTTAPTSTAPEAASFIAGETSLQFRWDTYQPSSASARLQLLSGMHVTTDVTPGFASAAFRVFTAANDVPTLHLTSSFVEALIRCRWGEFLQAPPGASSDALNRICGSSAGDLVFGYTGESQEAVWDEQYLLNGYLEVKDLVSWPMGMSVDAAGVRLTVPAARSSASLDHFRHTIRILFDQHEIPPGVLETAEGDLVFRLAPQRGWHFLAVVEHQLVDVLPGSSFTAPVVQNDRRWVTVQEVAFLSPASVKANLLAIRNDTLRLQLPAGGTGLVGDASYGLVGAGIRAQLAEGATPALDALPAGTILVETSAVHWIKDLALPRSPATAFQYLPMGAQLAVLSSRDDYKPTDPRDPAWVLLQMPFIGRLQDRANDAITPPPAAPALLQIDPVLDLHRRKANVAALPPLVLAFTSWAESTATTVTFSVFDHAVARSFARLDPRALEESWFYAQNKAYEPPPEGIRSVVAALPDTIARLGRPTTLAHLYRGARGFYPPQWNPSGDPVVPDATSDQLVWRPGHLHVVQAVASASPSGSPPFGWLSVALHLVTGLFRRTAGTPFGSIRHVAATQVPFHLAGAMVPTGLSVSPFLSLEFQPAPAVTELRIVVAELLALNATSGRLRPVASQSWESSDGDEIRAFAAKWARETHGRLSPESPVAVLRYRELRQAAPGSPATAAVLVTSYGFGLVPGIQPPKTLAKRVFRLRSPVAQLRFRDGRFGGSAVPIETRPFELAPPQMTGVEPLHLTERPAAASVDAAWPWGFSGLRTSVQYTEAREGVVGRTGAGNTEGVMLWWQSIQQAVQFRSGLGPDPAAGLPPGFRANAIASLLPVLPDPPLPALRATELFKTAASAAERRQPVLPGSVRTTIVGARPGAFMSLRAQLTRQSGLDVSLPSPQRGKGLVSGSVPVQHRVPRPIPLPANDADAKDSALRPWASAFEPTAGLLARRAPADEAFFAAFGGEPAHRLRVELVDPARAEIDAEWSGVVTAEVALDGPGASIDAWVLSVAIEHRGRTVRYGVEPPPDHSEGSYVFRPDPADAEIFRELLADLVPGEVIALSMRVTRATGTEGFFQTLRFPLRLADVAAQRLPLEPFFVLFEDPEYNRLLVSPAKNATALVKTLEDNEPTLHAVTISTDRAEYDPTSQLAVRYDWDDDRDHAAKLFMELVDSAGLARPLTRLGASSTPMQAHTLLSFPMSELFDGDAPARFTGSETILLTLVIAPDAGVIEERSVSVAVNVTLDPVTPVPQAAYALLRRQAVEGQVQVECARFAWSPPATRVELVCPNDLRTGVVRRRAVFLWTDTARRGAATGFAVQKITLTGSTHFPELDPISD